jgi:hypothetical protein
MMIADYNGNTSVINYIGIHRIHMASENDNSGSTRIIGNNYGWKWQ